MAKDRTSFLIERTDNASPVPVWLTQGEQGEILWTTDRDQAMKFVDRESAEAVPSGDMHGMYTKVVEYQSERAVYAHVMDPGEDGV